MLKLLATGQAGYTELADFDTEAGREIWGKAGRTHGKRGGERELEQFPAVENFDLGSHKSKLTPAAALCQTGARRKNRSRAGTSRLHPNGVSPF